MCDSLEKVEAAEGRQGSGLRNICPQVVFDIHISQQIMRVDQYLSTSETAQASMRLLKTLRVLLRTAAADYTLLYNSIWRPLQPAEVRDNLLLLVEERIIHESLCGESLVILDRIFGDERTREGQLMQSWCDLMGQQSAPENVPGHSITSLIDYMVSVVVIGVGVVLVLV